MLRAGRRRQPRADPLDRQSEAGRRGAGQRHGRASQGEQDQADTQQARSGRHLRRLGQSPERVRYGRTVPRDEHPAGAGRRSATCRPLTLGGMPGPSCCLLHPQLPAPRSLVTVRDSPTSPSALAAHFPKRAGPSHPLSRDCPAQPPVLLWVCSDLPTRLSSFCLAACLRQGTGVQSWGGVAECRPASVRRLSPLAELQTSATR